MIENLVAAADFETVNLQFLKMSIVNIQPHFSLNLDACQI